MKNTLNGIEAGRGIAAILVAIYHISRLFEQNFGVFPFTRISEVGHSGVDFFFVLSGFIIYFIHEKDINHPSAIKSYLIKRIIRVFPFYWVMLVLTSCLIPFVSSAQFPNLFDIFRQIFLLPMGMQNLIIGVSWTLQYEMIFYFAFTLLIFNKTLGIFIGTIWLTFVITKSFLALSTFNIPVVFSTYVLQFFMGCFAGFITLRTGTAFSKRIFYLGLTSLISIYILELSGILNGYGNTARLLYGVAFTVIIIGIVKLEKKQCFNVPNLIMTLGKSSYAIYLSHMFFGGIYYKIFDISGILNYLPLPVSAILVISITIYSSVLLSKWIELPLTAKMRKLLLKN